MATRTILDRGGLGLYIHDEAPEEAIELLENTLFGTDGGVRYRHAHSRQRIGKQINAQFLTLHKGERLLGLFGFLQRNLEQSAGSVDGYFLRYLSMMPTFQRNSSTGGEGSRRKADGLIKRLIVRLFARPEELKVIPTPEPESSMCYAYVELDNERSLEMSQTMGYEAIGQFSSVFFSRFSPKRNPSVQLLRAEDKETVRGHLRHFYRDHALFFDHNAFLEGPYYVCWDGGKIVAGFKANLCEWKIEEMAGWSGRMILKYVPKVPYLRDIFNPEAFRFFATEAMWHLPGYEMRLYDLLETALVDTDRHTAMIWVDQRSPLYKFLSYGHLGVLDKIQSDAPADVVARFSNVPEDVKADIRSKPLYISAFDSV